MIARGDIVLAVSNSGETVIFTSAQWQTSGVATNTASTSVGTVTPNVATITYSAAAETEAGDSIPGTANPVANAPNTLTANNSVTLTITPNAETEAIKVLRGSGSLVLIGVVPSTNPQTTETFTRFRKERQEAKNSSRNGAAVQAEPEPSPAPAPAPKPVSATTVPDRRLKEKAEREGRLRVEE